VSVWRRLVDPGDGHEYLVSEAAMWDIVETEDGDKVDFILRNVEDGHTTFASGTKLPQGAS
jgi:hypothetical protein